MLCRHCTNPTSYSSPLCDECYELKMNLLAHLEPYTLRRAGLDGLTDEDIAAIAEGGAPIRYVPIDEDIPF